MNIGILGLGSMGKMFLDRILLDGNLAESEVFVYNRSSEKLASIVNSYPSIHGCSTIDMVVKNSEVVIICTSPSSIKSVLEEVKCSYTADKILISVASCVSIANMESVIGNGKLIRIIPSFVSEIGEGIGLACGNRHITEKDMSIIEQLFGNIGYIKVVNEENIEILTELTSCSPGILSSIFDEFIQSAVLHGTINEREAIEVFRQTLYGLSRLYLQRDMSFKETIERVARKGGMTEIGVKEVKRNIPAIFANIFKKTIKRYKAKKAEMNRLFA
jgi:pyrroline-5-carboxylate reductase